MQIAHGLGKLDWLDVNAIRKLMGKSQGEAALNKYASKFIDGAMQNGVSQARAGEIWEQICKYGSYGFNKSHAVSYAILSYWTAWCKTYYPAQFFARILKSETEPEKLRAVLREWGGPVIPLDLSLSKMYFRTDGERLIGGFTNIKGIGEAAAAKIENGQPFACIDDFQSRIPAGVG